MSEEHTIRVPWTVGVEVSSTPRPARARPGRSDHCGRKVAQVRQDVELLRSAQGRVPRGEEKRREQLEREREFQARRAAWLEAAAGRSDRALRARQRRLERELGPEGVAYLEDGLPREHASDVRLLDLLGELAIVRHALEAEEEA